MFRTLALRHLAVARRSVAACVRVAHAQAVSVNKYEPQAVESKWQTIWKANPSTVTNEGTGPKLYSLAQFPYPSGALHMGHVRVYTLSDVVARHARMNGFAVLHPTGWDAFGLPAENAAIDRGIHPAQWTNDNIARMKAQVMQMGTWIDWSRELSTCDPDYYRWTQSLFLDLAEAGLVERRRAPVNWDPVDQTVLANEQVDAQGRSWRSGAVVERRSMEQWFVRITHYAEDLWRALDTLDWPAPVKALQRAWIGRSEGALVDFALDGAAPAPPLRVFTTRPDTLPGVRFLAVAAEHPLAEALPGTPSSPALAVGAAPALLTRGAAHGGRRLPVTARHPLTGESLPVYVAAYVLPEYGTGAVMGVPAHDERDAAFAREMGLDAGPPLPDAQLGPAAAAAVLAALEAGGCGRRSVQYRLHDWLVSRQRYWGAPIPFVHCAACGPVPVPRAELPVTLPAVTITGRGPSPLRQAREWMRTRCPKCGEAAHRDCDTMDTFVDSAWYFLRFCGRSDGALADAAALRRWMPVDVYVGGIEHATMHLLYARFVTRFLHSRGLAPQPEPFARLLVQGMVHGRTLRSAVSGRYLRPDEVDERGGGAAPVERSTGQPVQVTYEKMSKSKYNGVDPGAVFAEHGVDVARLYMLFAAPPTDNIDWSVDAIAGMRRWLQRVFQLVDTCVAAGARRSSDSAAEDDVAALQYAVHSAVASVTSGFERHAFNTVVSDLMKLSNAYAGTAGLGAVPAAVRARPEYAHGVRALVLMLAPLAPHAASELWARLERSAAADVHAQRWPVADPAHLQPPAVPLVVQVNGVRRAVLRVPAPPLDAPMGRPLADSEPVVEQARAAVAEHLQAGRVQRVVRAGRVVNFVLAP